MYGVRSTEGIVTQAPSLAKAKGWIDYEYKTVLGHVGEELVRFNGAEWVKHDG